LNSDEHQPALLCRFCDSGAAVYKMLRLIVCPMQFMALDRYKIT